MKKYMKNLLVLLVLAIFAVNSYVVKADELPKAYVRVVGDKGIIAQGEEQGATAFDLLNKLLTVDNHIDFKYSTSSYGKYITSIDGLASGTYAAWAGWMYIAKHPTSIESPMVGADQYPVKEGDTYVFYYGNWGETYVLNSIKFNPQVVQPNTEFTMTFGSDDGTAVTPLKNASVKIDAADYTTDDKGEIKVKGLSIGQHTYNITGYRTSNVPTVVEDAGTFEINGNTSPSFNYSDTSYKDLNNKNTNLMKDVNNYANLAENYLKANSDDPWAGITLSKLQIKGGESFLNSMAKDITEEGVDNESSTDLEKLIMNAAALGYNPYNFANADLVEALYSRNMNDFLVNDGVFALLANNFANLSGNYNITPDKLIEKLVKTTDNNGWMLPSGGWGLSGNTINPDITGAALSALAPYNDDAHPQVKSAITKAAAALLNVESANGYIQDGGNISPETQAFVILGLTSVGIDPSTGDFAKANGDVVSALLSFKMSDGTFKHQLADTSMNYLATEQATRALYSFQQFKNTGKYNFYSSNIQSEKLPVFKYAVSASENVNNNGSNNNGNANAAASANTLPQTGALVDDKLAIALAILFMAAGAKLVLNKRKID